MKQSVKSLFKLYLDRSDLAESSVAIKERALGFFIEAFGDMPVESVNYTLAEDYRTIVSKGRSKTSANMDIQNFKPFFSWLLKRGYITKNPFVGLSLLRTGEVKRPIYTPEEIERIISVGGLRWSVAVLLALCSMRRAEVLNLVVADIDFAKGQILVSPKKETAETWVWNIKDHNQAIVPMPERVSILIMKMLDSLPAGQPYVILKPKQYKRMIKRRAAGRLTFEDKNCPWQGFDRDYRALLKRARVDRKRYHDLRATFATTMAKHLPLTDTQKLMRHSSPNTTAKYYIRIEEEKLVAKASNIVEKYYSTNVP